MGFGFTLIGIPLLILITTGLLLYFSKYKKKAVLKVLGVVWLLPVLVLATGTIVDYFRKPVRLTKRDIIGEYCIDTTFYMGENAKWQYEHYRFIITPTDSIIFYQTNKDTVTNTYKEKILYSMGPPDLWNVQSDTTSYHVIRHPPTLYRGHNKFFYVLKSDHYGNMFFRKVKD